MTHPVNKSLLLPSACCQRPEGGRGQTPEGWNNRKRSLDFVLEQQEQSEMSKQYEALEGIPFSWPPFFFRFPYSQGRNTDRNVFLPPLLFKTTSHFSDWGPTGLVRLGKGMKRPGPRVLSLLQSHACSSGG